MDRMGAPGDMESVGQNPLVQLHQKRQQMLNLFIERDPQFQTIMQAVNMGVDPKIAFMKWGDRQNVAAFNQQDYTLEQVRQAALQQGYTANTGMMGFDTGGPPAGGMGQAGGALGLGIGGQAEGAVGASSMMAQASGMVAPGGRREMMRGR